MKFHMPYSTSRPTNLLLTVQVSLICFTTLIGAKRSNSDVPEKPASPAVATKAIKRGELFLRELQRLSTFVSVSDRDISQMWPRAESYMVFLPEPNKQVKIKRSSTVTVVSNLNRDRYPTSHAWTVKFCDNQIEFAMDPTCSQIHFFHDMVLSIALRHEPAPESTDLISPETACERSIAYLRAGNIDTGSLMLEYIKQQNAQSFQRTARDSTYFVSFVRQLNGVPFVNEGVNVTLDAGRGRLLAYGGRSIALDQPTPKIVNISLENAIQVAENKCREIGLKPSNGTYASLVYALPSDINGNNEVGRTPSLCWNAFVPLQSEDNRRTTHIVRIDVSTGEIIGGQSFQSRGGSSTGTPDITIMKLLSTATRLEVSSQNYTGNPVIVDTSIMKLKYLGALNGFTTQMSGSTPHPTQSLSVYSENGSATKFKYDAKAGILLAGSGKGLVVSQAMKSLLAQH